jgi:hypothetical protein
VRMTGKPGEGRGTIFASDLFRISSLMKLLKLLKPVLFLPVCFLTIAQCGLEYLPFLTAPISLGPSGTTFIIRKTADNDTESSLEWEYQGIELYYKFYIPTDFPDNNLTELSELIAKKFHRISHPDDEEKSIQKPLLDGTVLAGDVDFEIGIENLQITETSTPVVVVSEIRRGVPYGGVGPDSAKFRRFDVEDFEATDDDVVGTGINDYIAISASKITMVMYAFSYGKKDYVVDLYSDAVYLGEIDVNFGW